MKKKLNCEEKKVDCEKIKQTFKKNWTVSFWAIEEMTQQDKADKKMCSCSQKVVPMKLSYECEP